MMDKNRFEVSAYVPAELPTIDVDAYTKYPLADSLAREIADTFPVEITPQKVCGMDGTPDNIHKMVLYIFTEQQLNKQWEEMRKSILFSMAADRALYGLGDRVCN